MFTKISNPQCLLLSPHKAEKEERGEGGNSYRNILLSSFSLADNKCPDDGGWVDVSNLGKINFVSYILLSLK